MFSYLNNTLSCRRDNNWSRYPKMQKLALTLQLSHLAFSVIWNLLSVSFLALGMQALGPTSSLIWAFILTILAYVLWFSAQQVKTLYMTLSCFQLIAAASTIYNAFIKEENLWPSEFWRLSGVVLNTLGVIGSVIALSLLLILIIEHYIIRNGISRPVTAKQKK